MKLRDKRIKDVVCPICKSSKFVYKTAEETKKKLILNEWVCTKCNSLLKTKLSH